MNFVVEAFPVYAAQSWRMGCLICILGILRWAIRGRVSQQVLFGAWIIVALALLIPVSIPVAWSPASLASRTFSSAHGGFGVPAQSASQGIPSLLSILDFAATPVIPSAAGSHRLWVGTPVVAFWVLGAATLLALRVGMGYRFRSRLGRAVIPVNPKYVSAVLDCAELLRIRTPISVHESDAAAGPAMGGVWRPYLVIPSSLGSQLSDEELRLVILHELGHWRRRDAAANALIQCALMVHWFNPAVWLFAHMARFDCELACDEFVLGHLAASGRDDYGKTILKVLATVQRRSAPVVLLGILGGRQQIERRIDMIARFRTASFSKIASGCCLIALVAIVAATARPRALGADSVQVDKAAAKSQMGPTEMKPYRSLEWNFALDIPKDWNAFPPVSSNSPYEVIRFESWGNGYKNLLIVFRQPLRPDESPGAWSAKVQTVLARGAFGNFVTGKTTIGSREVVTLDFDKPSSGGKTWYCRQYFIVDGPLGYDLGFGTENRAEMFDLYDHMAKSFQMLK